MVGGSLVRSCPPSTVSPHQLNATATNSFNMGGSIRTSGLRVITTAASNVAAAVTSVPVASSLQILGGAEGAHFYGMVGGSGGNTKKVAAGNSSNYILQVGYDPSFYYSSLKLWSFFTWYLCLFLLLRYVIEVLN